MAYHNRDPIESLLIGEPFSQYQRHRIETRWPSRGSKALAIIDDGKVMRFYDFFVVIGEKGEYVVEDDFCTCDDFLNRGGPCGHILAVRIARAIGRYELADIWYYTSLDLS
ncbi:MAG: SWIM zinc finger family protein [Methanospirillaceae archaeon]|nr:SWIM zinc finger family protein [Methanospirillaceae archaeon]